jgi:three prime repair exonuclease-2
LDLETTGLPFDKPVRITEIAMVAVLREHILEYASDITPEAALPRVLSKLTVCVHPRRVVSKRAAEITRMLYSFCHSTQLLRFRLTNYMELSTA